MGDSQVKNPWDGNMLGIFKRWWAESRKDEIFEVKMEVYVNMLHLLVQPQLDLKTNNNQNCQKNQAVWKSNNQGFKEDTFIQTGASSTIDHATKTGSQSSCT